MRKKVRFSIREALDKLPSQLQQIIFKTFTEIRFLEFRLRIAFYADKNSPNPSKIFWISPKRILYHTNFLKNKKEKLYFASRVFPSNMRGKSIDGCWDITHYKFSDLVVYKSLKQRIEKGVEWKDTEYYKNVLRDVNSGARASDYWGIQNRRELDERCNYIDSLYESIRNKGYRLNRTVCERNSGYDEIEVNISRNGEYLFQNGVHRLSIAKILGIKYVPVMVFVRHKKWQDFKKYVVSYSKLEKTGKLYQPIVHPDLADVPYDLDAHDCHNLMKVLEGHLNKPRGLMLDIGANIGYFCHRFEDLGYQCYAVEKDPAVFQILERIKIAENKKFETINKSIFDVGFIKSTNFDVVLAFNIFHHFLKTKSEFVKLKKLLQDLKMNQMFFEPHKYDDTQMKNAFINFTEKEFIDFILQQTPLNKSEAIYRAKNGRTLFRLFK